MKKIGVLLLFCASQICAAQGIKEKNTDVLLKEGISQYKAQNLEMSLAYANKGLDLAPDYHDIRILRIRVFHRLKRLGEAMEDLQYLLRKAPNYYAVKDLAIRQMRLMEHKKALAHLDPLMAIYPGEVELKLLKAQLLFENDSLGESRKLALELIENDGLKGGQRYQLNTILRATVSDEFGMNYQYFSFGKNYNREDWQNFIFEYQHNFKKTTLLGRVTHSDRGFDKGQLYEMDIYPIITENLYFFGSLGVSSGSLFPDVKASTSVFYGFIDGFEGETGAKLLNINGKNYFTGILGLTHYVGKFYLNLRAAVGPRRMERTIQNYQFNTRYYYSGSDNYVFVRLSRGISPDESPLFVQVQENPGLDAYFVGSGINFQLGPHHILRLDTGLLFEEINSDTNGRQWLLNLGYRFRF
ncbi:YaiO family outer membrane beta-barrel protein [Flagellimonas halotolerans]|uniref:YaiO family outer membrane beta-barrel protein n=1 Tax=Flagellimonas halotolerans TaxID=3112164 RepID=A0ABU6IV51_9FLAO|nr:MULTISPECIES: YaiO family outer membrane beta-barrel protein [unclassified Allomuricauda]MEC3967098.1 YaiO family outer membrane beta-barrel protein [Muricauda sp. SYSU M86414]MEC4266961.1 YaiO family outer membrane beta-barrel protein [Muricauda sp. SYSU M84420]